ncbi:ABC transporter permease [bacterium]|nr:ABC transporter permease [bacterium]
MNKFIRIFVSTVLTLLAVSFLTFVLMKLVPGGPFDTDKAVPAEVLEALNKKFQLDLPWYKQYLNYMMGFFQGDFGPSIKYPGVSVKEIIQESFPVSLELGIYALTIAVVVGVGLGIVAALYRGTALDFTSMLIAVSGISLPSFMVAAIAILIFSHGLGVLPAALWDSPAHKIMPSIILGLRPAAIIARFTRSSLLEVLGLDFIRTAKAKGLSKAKVVTVHALKNSLLPVLTILGPMAASILTGSFIIEHVFSVPGLATNYIQGVTNRDYPLIMGVTMLFAFVLVMANLIVDLSYSILDPRMKEQS